MPAGNDLQVFADTEPLAVVEQGHDQVAGLALAMVDDQQVAAQRQVGVDQGRNGMGQFSRQLGEIEFICQVARQGAGQAGLGVVAETPPTWLGMIGAVEAGQQVVQGGRRFELPRGGHDPCGAFAVLLVDAVDDAVQDRHGDLAARG